MTGREASLRTKALVAGAALLGGLFTVACYNRITWNAVFDRTSPGGPYYPDSVTTTPVRAGGWVGGDGASTVKLPDFAGRQDRTLWLLSDSGLYDAKATHDWVLGPSNTIAVHDVARGSAPGTPPSDGEIHWYARDKSNKPVDVTMDGSSAAGPFFPDPGPESAYRFYPGDGFVMSDGRLYVFLNEFTKDTLRPVNGYVASIDNPGADVMSWGAPVNHVLVAGGVSPLASLGMQWGNAVIDAGGGFVYIFGMSTVNGVDGIFLAMANPSPCTPATNPCIANYAQWLFLKANGAFAQGPPARLSDLEQIANIAGASEFSVDRITLTDGNGVPQTRYVMVHGRPFLQNDMIIQISRSDSITDWAPLDPNVPSQYHWIGSIGDDRAGLDPTIVLTGDPDVATCNHTAGNVWANKGHYDLSPAPSGGHAAYHLSYYASVINFGRDANDNRRYCSIVRQGPPTGSLRFTNAIDLMKLRPWCVSSCWN